MCSDSCIFMLSFFSLDLPSLDATFLVYMAFNDRHRYGFIINFMTIKK
jgi:hypothetical protein